MENAVENTKDSLQCALSASMPGFKLINIKFFLGDDPNITLTDVREQLQKVLTQDAVNSLKPKDAIDSDMPQVDFDDFMKKRCGVDS